MTEILRLLHGQAPPRLPDNCATVLGVDTLALSLVVEGQVTEQLWSSDETSAYFEDLQFTLGEGPGPDALRMSSLVLEWDILASPAGKWPALLPAMTSLPIKAVFCFPLCLGAITVGVLTALRSDAGTLTGQQIDDALALAEALTLQFLGGDGVQLDAWTGSGPAGELHRAVVHQATGMISVQLGLSLGQSLLRLRAYAFSHDQPITETAREVVARRLRLSDTPSGTASTDEKRG
jgi:hypothetical protein